ncbi:MAG: pilus assembly protein PilM [Acholeplasmataceae bacterium]|nr:pilus assembly protein PilM [Acholeplasmataceae bacterium]
MAKRREVVNIFITDESIGIFQASKKDGAPLSALIELEKHVIENGYIKEPESLLLVLKTLFKEHNIKTKSIHMVIHDQNILIRKINIKKEELQKKSISNFLNEQKGKTIHFPFDEPNISYAVQSEDETSMSVATVITDENCLHDYHDIFDKLGAKNVHFDVSPVILSQLYTSDIKKKLDHLMVVSVFDSMLTINLLENGIPIFGMIEEFEGNLKSFDEMIESYIERVANYYKFNIKKGLESISQAVLFNFSKQISNQHLKSNIKPESENFKLDIFRMNELEGINNSHDLCLMAYAENQVINTEKDNQFNISIERVKKLTRYGNFLLVLSFAVFTAIALIYIPLFTFNQDINNQMNRNNILQYQLDMLTEDTPEPISYTDIEINYSQAYDYINSQIDQPSDYYSDLLSEISGSLEVSHYTLNAQTHEIQIWISSTSEVELYEYLVTIYEAYGVTSIEDATRWMVAQPERRFISNLLMEVTIHYA